MMAVQDEAVRGHQNRAVSPVPNFSPARCLLDGKLGLGGLEFFSRYAVGGVLDPLPLEEGNQRPPMLPFDLGHFCTGDAKRK